MVFIVFTWKVVGWCPAVTVRIIWKANSVPVSLLSLAMHNVLNNENKSRFIV